MLGEQHTGICKSWMNLQGLQICQIKIHQNVSDDSMEVTEAVTLTPEIFVFFLTFSKTSTIYINPLPTRVK